MAYIGPNGERWTAEQAAAYRYRKSAAERRRTARAAAAAGDSAGAAWSNRGAEHDEHMAKQYDAAHRDRKGK